MNEYIFTSKPLPYFLGILSNKMQSTFHKALTNAFKKSFKKRDHKIKLYPPVVTIFKSTNGYYRKKHLEKWSQNGLLSS